MVTFLSNVAVTVTNSGLAELNLGTTEVQAQIRESLNHSQKARFHQGGVHLTLFLLFV